MKKKQIPNYWLVVSTDSYTGNFERELIAYTFGILDEVQMDIDYGTEYLEQFYKEENMTYEQCVKELNEYLFETYQEVDDWEQMTFYNIDSYKDTAESGHCNAVWIQLDKPFDGVWKDRVIKRIIDFFNKKIYMNTENAIWYKHFKEEGIYKTNPSLFHLELLNSDKNLIEKFV